MRLRLLSSTGVLCAALVLIAGCSSGREPSSLETPDVVWPSGAPSGAFEDTDAVKAFRAQEIAGAVAWNAMDFSDPSLVEAIGIERAASMAESREEWHSTFAATGEEKYAREEVMLGPEPTGILGVEDKSDGTVRLIGCVESRLVESGRQVQAWILTPRESGGFRVDYDWSQSEFGEPYESDCAAMSLPTANFDPAPEPNLDREAKVVGPADESTYTFD